MREDKVMSEKKINLTEAEWHVMECLWKSAPQTGRQLVEGLKEKVGWSKSTTLTMLSRMTGKEIISCDESGQVRLYAPCIDREAAVQAETANFLKRVYKGSVGLMMSAMAEKQELSAEEIEELYAILERYKSPGQK